MNIPQYQFLTSKYNGKIISLPITANYNFKIYQSVPGSLRVGASLNTEISSNFDYPTEVSTDYCNFFVGITGGINLNYNTDKTIYFIGFEPMFGTKRGSTTGIDFNNKQQTQYYEMENYLFNVGIKLISNKN